MLDKVQEFVGQLHNAHTQAAYGNDLNQFYEYLSRRTPPVSSWQEVREEHVRGFLDELMRREYAASSIARKIAVVKSFFAFLEEQRVVAYNPADHVEVPRPRHAAPRVLTPEEVERLMSAAADSHSPKGLRDRALLELMYATGLRASEVVSLVVDDVDLERGVLRFRPNADRVLTLALPARTVEALRAYLERARSRIVAHPDEPHLFLNLRGRPLTRQGLWLIIRDCVRRADIPAPVSPHTLRHTFVAHRARAGDGAGDDELAAQGHARDPLSALVYEYEHEE